MGGQKTSPTKQASADPLETQKFCGSACCFTEEAVGEPRPDGRREGKKNSLKIDCLRVQQHGTSAVLFMKKLWFVNEASLFGLDKVKTYKTVMGLFDFFSLSFLEE